MKTAVFLLLVLFGAASTAIAEPLAEHFRRPVAATCVGPNLFVANRDSGTVTAIDMQNRRVVHETQVAKQLTDLVAIDQQRMVAIDRLRHELLLLQASATEVSVLQRVSTPRFPIRVAVDRDGGRIIVAGLWSRRLAIYQNTAEDKNPIRRRSTVDLRVAPRELCLLPDGCHLVVADGFSGTLELVDLSTAQSIARRTISGHSIGGLCLTGKDESARLLITHQVTQSLAPTTRSRVFWGNVVGNVVTGVELAEVMRKDANDAAIGHYDLLPLGEPNHGTGDPARLAVATSGKTVVCLAGVGEVALRPALTQPMARYAVGRRPTSVCLSQDERWAFVTNTLSDSISVIDMDAQRVADTISLGPTPSLDSARRGELIFHDATVSLDGWFSCHSCHVDGHTNEQLNDNFGDETEGAPKRVPSLLGVASSGPWSWSGGRNQLSEQLHKSLITTMRGEGKPVTDQQVSDLASYLATLDAAPSLMHARSVRSKAAIRRGQRIFQDTGCMDCHAPPTYTSADTYDVGIHDELGRKRFNPPSLRGVSQRSFFFHDNRAKSLSEVLQMHGGVDLSELDVQAKKDLIAFLKSL